MRRNRSDLLSRVAVHSEARRAGHLRAGPLPLLAMHPRPASLLSAARLWHSLFCPELYHAPIIGPYHAGRELIASDSESQPSKFKGEFEMRIHTAESGATNVNMPRFTAECALSMSSRGYWVPGFDQGERSTAAKDNQIYMQRPNSENTPGGSCTGRISGTTISGHYDSMGRCCEDPAPFKVRACIDCDYPNHCSDGLTISGTFTFGTLGGVFARF